VRTTTRVFFVAAAAATLIGVFAAGASASDLTVTTASGDVEGVIGPSGNEWRGIPYAAPPVGDLRWRPPAPVTPWSGVRDATSFASPCIQPGFPTGTFGSEDCLYLNVFVPASASAASGLPVMVHLHPGSNFFGAPYTDAGAFTSRGVIVVTVGYRLGVLGFMGHPALTREGHSGEYGVLDQVAALRWVHENIGAFGGDASRVTLFGSSAGSFDTVAVVASPLSTGLIARAAVQGIAFWPLTGTGSSTLTESEGFGTFVADALGCSSSSDVLDCLRGLPAEALVEAAGPGDIGGPPVGESVLPKPPLELLRDGAVPLLVGFDREEDAPFTDPFQDPYTTQNWVRDTNRLVGSSRGRLARSLYPSNEYDSLLWSYITMQTDAVHGCPTRRLANVVASKTVVWRYLYTHVYENDPFFAQFFRASHVLEEPLLWHADVLGFGYTPTAAEEQLSRRMTAYWTNFAKSGNPNGIGLPTWPQYDTVNEPTLTLDDTSDVIAAYHRRQCGLMDSLSTPFPPPGEPRQGPPIEPPGFLYDHARAP
jgi:para-nitrobenzyl esterase